MDRAGRVQVPRDYREALALTRRVRLALEADHVTIRPDRDAGRHERADWAAARPLLKVRGVHRTFGTGPDRRARAARTSRSTSRRHDGGARRPVRLRQDHAAQHHRRPGPPGRRDRPRRRHRRHGLDEDGLSRLRREKVSYVFQTFGLIPVLSAAENVGVPLRLARVAAGERERRVELLLDLVGLADHAEQRPGELSGGQQQRVAIARALAASPRLLIADEPTGQLDAETGLSVMALLRGVVESEGVTALVSTHDPVMIALADRVIRITDGQLTNATGAGP